MPPDEAARLAALRAENLLDTPAEAEFDDVAKIASIICGTPIALVSLVDADRQWFKARVGLDAPETPRDVAFCSHAILQREVFVVSDAFADERFADNPLVTGAPHVRFYAGAPLMDEAGLAFGTLCVIDHEPRTLDPARLEALNALARQVMGVVALRRAMRVVREERRAREEAAVIAERFFGLSLDLLCIASTEGKFVRMNPAWEAVLGYAPSELEGRAFMDLVHPDDVAVTGAEIGRPRDGRRTIPFPNRFRARDGSFHSLEWHAAPEPETGLLFAAARDVTEQVQANERTETILDASASGMLVVADDGRIRYANRAARQLLGYVEAELHAMSVDDLVPSDAVTPHTSYRAAFAASRVTRTMGTGRVVRARCKDGSEREVEITLTPTVMSSGDVTVATLVDVTERRAVERLKNEFVSVVSHELRTPLTSIRGSLRLLEAGVKGSLPEQAARLVGIASSNTERLIRLINDILDIEKIEAGKLELSLAPVRLTECIEAALNSVRGVATAAEVSLEVDAPGDLVVTADADRLVQVLVNLLSNAVQYSPRSGVVRLVAGLCGTRHVRCAVADHGPGIAAADVPRLFEKFAQLDASDARAKGGSGLGLAITRAIVLGHRGRIGVDSAPGAGSTFWFELPAAAERAALVPDADAASRAPSTTSRTLLVEDDPDAAEITRAFLEGAGLSTLVAPTLADARRELERGEIGLVVLDLHLPDGHGLTLLEWMRAREQTKATPVIVLTGSSNEGAASHPFLVDWLRKPLDDGALQAAILRSGVRSAVARALVVEDDDSTREVMVEMLRRAGVQVREARSGAEALAVVEQYSPDLIILDVGLPVLDGFQVVEALPQQGPGAPARSVYSGPDPDAAQRAVLTLGSTRHLTKSAHDGDALVNAVRQLIERS